MPRRHRPIVAIALAALVSPLLPAAPAAADVCTDPAAPGCEPLPPVGKTQTVNQGTGWMGAVPGDYDGDGLTDVFWHKLEFNASTMWWGIGEGRFEGGSTPPPLSYATPGAGDFDGDGDDDLLWPSADLPTGVPTLWTFDGREVTASPTLPVTYGHDPIYGDYNGDGAADVLWYSWYEVDELWYGGPDGFTTLAVDAGTFYRPSVGDFDGDGRSDVLWVPQQGGEVVWFGEDQGFTDRPFLADGDYLAVIGDWDGDGDDDVLWHLFVGGDVLWMAEGRAFTGVPIDDGSRYPPVPVDLDGDGDDDLVALNADAMGALPDSILRAGPGGFVPEPLQVVGQYSAFAGEFGGSAAEDVLFVNGGPVVDPVWWG